jgi:hypothetical protein
MYGYEQFRILDFLKYQNIGLIKSSRRTCNDVSCNNQPNDN